MEGGKTMKEVFEFPVFGIFSANVADLLSTSGNPDLEEGGSED